ncbi:uncharacterized protein LOC142633086 [Castanea sativa]|uniref:uncharacterized protein LOC142633086 n=1 Tax=Castanea sativa TaxID=21020 RepID=UPI003F6515E5
MDPIPPLGKVFSLLLQDEKQRKARKKHTIESSALAVRANGSSKTFNKAKSGRPQCTHCGVLGHVADKCYKLHGYSLGYKFKNKGSYVTPFANNVVATDASLDESVNLTRSEYQQFLGLLNSHSHFGLAALEDMIGLGKKQGGLYTLQSQSTASLPTSVSVVLPKLSRFSSFCFNSCTSAVDKTSLWHSRLGHPSPQRLVLLQSLVPKVITCNINKTFDCSVCPLAKQKRLPFPTSTSSSPLCFDQIHADIWGPYSTPSLNGSETDNGPEFALNSFYASKGIIHQLSCLETPQQNSVVETKHQHLLDVARALRFEANLPLKFWGDCVLTATYLINRIPSPLLHDLTPFQMLLDKPPSYDHLRSFDYLCYASTLARDRSKFDPRAKACIFLGYPFGTKGYKLYDLASRTCFVSRDVVFKESYLSSLPISTKFTPAFTTDIATPPDEFPDLVPLSSDLEQSHSAPDLPMIPNSISPPSPQPLRKSSRPHKTPSYLLDYHCNLASSHVLASASITQSYDSSVSTNSAILDPRWQEAMQAEFDAFKANNT